MILDSLGLMKRFPTKHLRFLSVSFFAVFILIIVSTSFVEAKGKEKQNGKGVTLDFNNVDLPVLVKLVSELTGKNFVIDEKVRGKVSIISPKKIPANRVYEVFLSVLELKGLTVVKSGDIHQIRPFAEVPPERSVHVVRLVNMKVEEMAKVLRGLIAKPATRGRSTVRSKKGIAAEVQILSDKETNSLIITATDSDFETLKAVIEELDLKRRQVYVEAVVLEISADKFKEIGTDISAAFGGTFDLFGSENSAGAFGGLNGLDISALSSLAGTGVSIGSFNIQAIMRALKSSSDVNILSTPQILTSDKQKAEIVVAQNVPFPGAQSQTVGGNVQTTIERKDVGIILRLTPDVLDDERVQLDVYQEISSVVETVQTSDGADLGPTTNKRSASTTIVAKSGQTIVIGGLIKDNVISIDRKVPFLGDIPILGWLFHFQSSRIEKTNLMVFLTPHIILDDEKLEELRRNKAGEISGFLEEAEEDGPPNAWGARFKTMINLPE